MRRLLPVLLLLLSACIAQAQQVTLPRATAPLSLYDGGVARWQGLPRQAVGARGLRFTFPKWERGAEEWPAVSLSYDGGKGYPTKDWSHYALLSFEARVEGRETGDLTVEFRDREGENGPTVAFQVEPGKKNRCEVLLHGLPATLDLTNVVELVFFTARPARSYTIGINHLRLLPGDKPPLAELSLAYPNYRELIFPDAGPVTVEACLHPEEYDVDAGQLRLRLSLRAGDRRVTAEGQPTGGLISASLAVDEMPPGSMRLRAEVVGPSGGRPLAVQDWELRKLTPAEVSKLKVYIDRRNNTIVDGKPFFPLGWFDRPDEGHLAEIADSPFNCVLDYGVNRKPKVWMQHYLDEVQRRGLKLIYCMNDVYPTATFFEHSSWEGIKGNQAIADAVVQAYREHPAVLAWYLNDERPRSLARKMTDYYQRVREADPNHPSYIVLYTMPDLPYYLGTTDVMGVDPYPVPRESATLVNAEMEAANAATRGHHPTWLVPQAFGWYQYWPEGSDRGRTPTAEELSMGRAPTYEEERCMTYLALTHGAKGLIYYCYYDLRVLPQYETMWQGLKKIAAEVKALTPDLLLAEDLGEVTLTPANPAIHTRLLRHEGHLTLLAVNADAQPQQAHFALNRPLPANVGVRFEGKTVPTSGTGFTAEFGGLEVHVYEWGEVPAPTDGPLP
jgi:hypothetical protein